MAMVFSFPLQACQQSVTNFAQACREWGESLPSRVLSQGVDHKLKQPFRMPGINIGTNQPSIFYAGDTVSENLFLLIEQA